MVIRLRDIPLDYYAVKERDKRTKETTVIITREEKKERKKHTRSSSRTLQNVLSMSSYPSCKLGIGERRHVRYCAFDERESVFKKAIRPCSKYEEQYIVEGGLPIEFLE